MVATRALALFSREKLILFGLSSDTFNMKFFVLILFFLAPNLSFASWNFFEGTTKNEIFQSHVLIREVAMGRTQSLAAVIQNTKASSTLYPDFKKETPDNVAHYLLKTFSTKFEKEKLESVYLYRTETKTDHIRLMVKKRKNDFLISFAFVKKQFLFRGYNETDFFQRLFIASENQKSNEKMTTKLFLIPGILLEQQSYAAGFSSDAGNLLGSVNQVMGQANLKGANNFIFASQQIGPSIINGASQIAGSLRGGVTSLNGLSSAGNRLADSFAAGSRGIESSLNNLGKVVTNPKTALIMGAGFMVGGAIGTMFSNAVALVVNSAYTALKTAVLDFFDIYNPGEKEKLLAEVNQSWGEYQSLEKEMYMHEQQVQNLEIALQLASGKTVEELFDVNPNQLSQSQGIKPNASLNSCQPSTAMDPSQIENLKSLAAMIKGNPEIRKQLCQKLDQTMDTIESMATEMNIVRTQISKNMLVTYNSVIENKQRSLHTPQVVSKAIKECKANAEDASKAHSDRFSKWKCSSHPETEDCVTLKKLIAEIPKEIEICERKGRDIIERDDDQYIKTASSLRLWRQKMNGLTDDFLRSECTAESNRDYCSKQDGTVTQVKKIYNANLDKMKKSQCEDLKTARFQLNTKVLAGKLPAAQADLTPLSTQNLVAASGDIGAIDARLPAGDAALDRANPDDVKPSEPNNFIVRGWNAFMGGVKSFFKWFF